MSISCVNRGDDGFLIRVDGVFDYTLHTDFKDVINKIKEEAPLSCTVDMSGVSSMDSSALGMMMLLRSELISTGQVIDIVHCQPQIYLLFKTANFDRYFTFMDQ